MSPAAALSIVALVAALAQMERKGFLQAMLSRPIVVGALLGALLDDPASGLMLGALLELFWLGGMNIGANLPDNEVVGTAAVVGAAIIGSGAEPVPLELATLAVVLIAPIAIVARWVDTTIEKKNSILVERSRRRLESNRSVAPLNLLGLLFPAVAAAILSAAGALGGALALPLLVDSFPEPVEEGLALAFPVVLAASAGLAISSIRIDRARGWAGAAAALGLVALFLHQALVGAQ